MGSLAKRVLALASLTGICAMPLAAANHEPQISGTDPAIMMLGLPEGVEVVELKTRFGICGEKALVVMDPHCFQIWCGEYTFMHPSLGESPCYSEKLERRPALTSTLHEWNDLNCDGMIEAYRMQDGDESRFVDYSDVLTVQMGESIGGAEGSVVNNADMFIDAANSYAALLIDMKKDEAAGLWDAYNARHAVEAQE